MLGIHSTETPTSREAKFKPTLKYAVTCNFFLFKNLLSLRVCTCSHAHAYGNTHEQACAHTHICMHMLHRICGYQRTTLKNCLLLSLLCASWRLSSHHKACTGRAFTCFPILLALQLSILSSPCITILIGLAASFTTCLIFKYYFTLCPY